MIAQSHAETWLVLHVPALITCRCGVFLAMAGCPTYQTCTFGLHVLIPILEWCTFCLLHLCCADIEAGQGMIAQGRNVFKGMDCPENTYGAAGKVYGWAAAPCKPCPRNMITDGLTNVNNSDVCINPDGFGYASEGASRCAPGFYASKGSRKACKRCPDGRTTEDDPSKQRYIGDCDVAPGYGVAGGSVANGDIFQADLSGLSEQQILDLTVLQCPTGYYGGGDSLTATCIKCPDGSTTKDPGSISVGQCDGKCLAV